MIIFDLSCDNGHKFEGWFRSADDFDQQLQTRLITCPQCDSHVVQRIPSVVAIASHPTCAEVPSRGLNSTAASSTALMRVGRESCEILKKNA